MAGLALPVLPAFAVDDPAAPTVARESYLVTFVDGVSADEQASILASAGATSTDAIPPLRMQAVTIPAENAAATAEALRATDGVTAVNLDRSRSVGAAPSDPSFDDQWALPRISWGEARNAVPSPAGSSIVAVLDTGVDGTHPDLDGQLVAGTSLLDGGNELADPNGHGTAMAGIVAARTDNAVGVAGVGYAGVSVMPVQVLGADGTGQDSDVIAGLVWAVNHDADVALMSFSAPQYSEALQTAIDWAWSRGVVSVAAVGNDGASIATFPAGDRGVVGVSSTDSSDGLAMSSNSGPAVFMAAPGEGITTLGVGGGVTTVSGTSAAAAVVAGSAAALAAADTAAGPGVLVGRLARNADAAGSADQTGNGRVNLGRAIGDTSTEVVRPAGATPVGDSGPFVGPYVAAARNYHVPFAGPGTGTVQISVDRGTVNAPTSCGGTGTSATSQTIFSDCSPNITNNDNDAVVTFKAIPASGSTFTGWTAVNLLTGNCSGTTSPCTGTFTGNGTITVNFGAANQPPAVDLNGGGAGINTTASFTENGSAVALAPTATVTDGDNANLASAQVQLTNRPDGAAESLSVTGCAAGITVTAYNTSTGVLALNGPATKAEYQACLRAVTYLNTSEDPSSASRLVDYTVNDGTATNSPLARVTLSVIPVNDRPMIDLNAGAGGIDTTASFSENGSAVALAPVATVTDVDNANLASAQVQLTNRPDGSAESLSVTGCAAGITVTPYNASTGVLALGGSASKSSYESCLRAVAYVDTSDNPSGASRVVEYTVDDGALTSSPFAKVTVTVVAVNDAPTVSLTGATSAGEGQARGYTFSVLDLDGSTFSVAAGFPDCGTGGTLVPGSLSTTAAGGSFDCSFPDGPASPTVRIKVTDSDGADSNVDTEAVSVVNVAPTVVLSGAVSVDEGQTKTYSYVVTDPGADSFTAVESCGGNGVRTDTAAVGSFDCTFPDGPASSSVSVTVDDGDPTDNTGSDSKVVAVGNVKPVVTKPSDQVSDEGASSLFHLGSFTDPGDDDPWSAVVDWGDGSADATFTEAVAGGIADKSHTYADNGDYTVTVTVREEPGDASAPSDTVTFTVSVANVAPTVVLSGDTSANEGESKGYSFTVTDPGADIFTVASGFPDCGSGGSLVAGSVSMTASGGSFGCSFPDGPVSPTVRIKVTDSDGADSNVDNKSVTVANVSPVVDPASSATLVELNQVSGQVTTHVAWSDAGVADGQTVTIEYTLTSGTYVTTRTSTYRGRPSSGSLVDAQSFPPGCYTVEVKFTTTDKDGAVSSVLTRTSGSSADFYASSFKAPIKNDERNIAKFGNVVPVKVQMNSMCTGLPVTSPTLHITVAQGILLDNDAALDDPNIVAESVSSADSGTQMRIADSMYIYNLGTKKLAAGQDYTIRIREGSVTGPIILRALFLPKK